jgi:hypothetical protein
MMQLSMKAKIKMMYDNDNVDDKHV